VAAADSAAACSATTKFEFRSGSRSNQIPVGRRDGPASSMVRRDFCRRFRSSGLPLWARAARNSGLGGRGETCPGKLDRVLRGQVAPRACFESLTHAERSAAADEKHSANPPRLELISMAAELASGGRDCARAVLSLAKETEFGKGAWSIGRSAFGALQLLTRRCRHPMPMRGDLGPRPGCSMLDAPTATRGGESAYLTGRIPQGTERIFTLLSFSNGEAVLINGPNGVTDNPHRRRGAACVIPAGPLPQKRYDAEPGSAYLLRPRWLYRSSLPSSDACG